MRHNLAFVLLSLGLVGLLFFILRPGRGPELTGPDDAQVRVSDVPNPAIDDPPSATAGTGDPSATLPAAQPDSADDIWALPAGFRQLLARDAIFPIYDPQFTTAAASTWPEDALVIGVEINGDARAYPIGPLNRREMVIDTIGDVPVLVSW